MSKKKQGNKHISTMSCLVLSIDSVISHEQVEKWMTIMGVCNINTIETMHCNINTKTSYAKTACQVNKTRSPMNTNMQSQPAKKLNLPYCYPRTRCILSGANLMN